MLLSWLKDAFQGIMLSATHVARSSADKTVELRCEMLTVYTSKLSYSLMQAHAAEA